MLRQSLIAASFAVATMIAATASGNADPVSLAPAAATNHAADATHHSTTSHARARVPVHYRTIVHHVYTYEPVPAPYYYEPYYAPAPPVAALPAAAACVALSLIGGC